MLSGLSAIIKDVLVLYSITFASVINVQGELFTTHGETAINETAKQVLNEITEKNDENDSSEPVNTDPEEIVLSANTEIQDTSSPPPTILSEESKNVPIPPEVKDISATLLQKINEYRVSSGILPYEATSEVCAFARIRAAEIQSDFSHRGFDTRYEGGQLPYPSFTKAAENIASAPSYERTFTLWKNSPGHNKNLLSGSPYACIANYGNFYAFESWTP